MVTAMRASWSAATVMLPERHNQAAGWHSPGFVTISFRDRHGGVMKLLYFAWVRTNIGKAEEEVAAPDHVQTVEDLLDWLATLGPHYAAALDRRNVVKVAVNHEYVEHDHPVRPDDEVALFPPVTGG
jgi:molybdopterin synthase sulfur carrier subunit